MRIIYFYIWVLFVSVFMIFPATATTEPAIIPRIHMSQESVRNCGMSLRTPATLFGSAGCFSANGERPQNSTSHCKGVLITAGCLGSLVEKKSANLSFEYYQFNFEYRDTVRLIEPSVYRMDLQSFIYSGADEVPKHGKS